MRPDAPTPWRKTLRRESKGLPSDRPARQPEPDVIRRGSTWMRRHWWMPDELREALYEARAGR